MSEADRYPDEPEIRAALQDALSDRFDGVDWERLHDSILADAAASWPEGPHATDVLVLWARRGIAPAGALLAASLAALLLLPDRGAPATAPPGFWPVAEDLMHDLPADTRRLIEAGTDAETMLQIMLGNGGKETDRT